MATLPQLQRKGASKPAAKPLTSSSAKLTAEHIRSQAASLYTQEKYKEAISLLEKQLIKHVSSALLWTQLGCTYLKVQAYTPACKAFDRALSLNPDEPLASFNKGLALLYLGELGEGYRYYEYRKQLAQCAHFALTTEPLLEPQHDLQDKRVLVRQEQGLGDSIQMLRYVALLQAKGAQVLLLLPDALHSIAQAMLTQPTLVKVGDTLDKKIDYQVYMMSLPLVCHTNTVADIPAVVPYLTVPPAHTTKWAALIPPCPNTFKVGLVWSGGLKFASDQRRSLSLLDLKKILMLASATGTAKRIQFYSLQKEYRDSDAKLLPNCPVIDLSAQLDDFSDTAALINCMDLVISVDTSVAHLAGALAKPLWILLPYANDPRWLASRTDSPWYPTATLYRQKQFGQWGAVLQQVEADLHAVLNVPS